MTIEELINKTKLIKSDFINNNYLYLDAYNILINQLLILSQENNGVLPNEFILSDNTQVFVNLQNIVKLFKLLDIQTNLITADVSVNNKLNNRIPRTIYSDEFYKLYLVKIQN